MNPLYVAGHRVLRTWWSFTRPYLLGVRVLVVRDGAVLLVRHSYRRSLFLPGGGPDRGETLETTARREVQEETGAILGHLDLHGVYTGVQEGSTDHVVVFSTTEVRSFDFRPSFEIVSAAFYPLSALPEDVSPASLRRIRELGEGVRGVFAAW